MALITADSDGKIAQVLVSRHRIDAWKDDTTFPRHKRIDYRANKVVVDDMAGNMRRYTLEADGTLKRGGSPVTLTSDDRTAVERFAETLTPTRRAALRQGAKDLVASVSGSSSNLEKAVAYLLVREFVGDDD